MNNKFIILACILLLFSCDNSQKDDTKNEFEALMGSRKKVWEFVQTHEDRSKLEVFKSIYMKNKDLQNNKNHYKKMPKIIHFIWIGPNPFPKESVENIQSWVSSHPEYQIKFWSDRRRPLPNKKMQLNLVADFEFKFLKECYDESDNYAEKADLLRYELIYQEGGIYVDHDVQCHKTFNSLIENYDFFCGVEPPKEQVFLSSSVNACNNLIAARPSHPVLEETIKNVLATWDEFTLAFPNNDKESTISRVAHRTFAPFDKAVINKAAQGEDKDIIFPAGYFNILDGDMGHFAHHFYSASWYEDETKFEKNVRKKLTSITKKNNQILLFNGVILIANLALFSGLFFQYQSLKRINKK